jgi:hypothetical protein
VKVNRAKFLQHLERILCGKQFTEVVFFGGFAVNALTPDQMLMVVAPGLPNVEPLKEPIGVSDVDLLSRATNLLKGEGNLGVEVQVYVDDNRLVVNDGDRGVQEQIIASPRTIATVIEQETVDQVMEDAPTGKAAALSKSIVEGVRGTFGLYKAEEIEVQVGPKGTLISVGTERTHRAKFKVDFTSKEEYTLIFGKHFVDVLGVISDYSSAAIRFGGEGKAIVIEDGGYKYLLSPKIRSEDEKPAVKGDAPAETEGGTEGGDEEETTGAPHRKGSKRVAKKKSGTKK